MDATRYTVERFDAKEARWNKVHEVTCSDTEYLRVVDRRDIQDMHESVTVHRYTTDRSDDDGDNMLLDVYPIWDARTAVYTFGSTVRIEYVGFTQSVFGERLNGLCTVHSGMGEDAYHHDCAAQAAGDNFKRVRVTLR